MADPRMEKWAKALVGYSVEVKAGQTVAIVGQSLAAAPLLREINKEVIRKGAFPVNLPSLEGAQSDLLNLGTDEQLQFVSPVERFIRTEADVAIQVLAETNTRRMSAVDPSRQALYQSARRGLLESFLERAADGRLDWTMTLYPTDAYAQDADMDTEAYADFVLGACKLDREDPVAAWLELKEEQQRLIDWLDGKKEVHLSGPDIDLHLSIEGRTWINSDGKRNFPSGEIFTGPVETSANGTIRFSFPVVTAGRKIEDIRLRFEGGKVVEASAARNEAYLIQQLDTDPGARFLGEFAFGTNFDITQFTSNILFDEKIGGTVHMALGLGYPETGSSNKSAIHWDMIADLRKGGVVTVDGEPFLKDGQFVV
jgi:aminopeptidase